MPTPTDVNFTKVTRSFFPDVSPSDDLSEGSEYQPSEEADDNSGISIVPPSVSSDEIRPRRYPFLMTETDADASASMPEISEPTFESGRRTSAFPSDP